MREMVLLVDLENVHKVDLARIPAHARVKIFVGAQQTKLSTTLVQQAHALGTRLEWVRIDGNGSNALDFHIACHLGEGITKSPDADFIVLSKDKGFDPLISHLRSRKFKCRREERATPAAPPEKPKLDANAQAVVTLLQRNEKNKRPRKRTTLTNFLVTHFAKKLSAEQVAALIEQLISAGKIAGTDAALVYQF
jgi:hypothetical protein